MTYPPRRRWSFFDIDFSHREWSFLPTMLSRCWFVRNPNHYFRSSLSTFSLVRPFVRLLAAFFRWFVPSFAFSMHSFAGSSLHSPSRCILSLVRPFILLLDAFFRWFVPSFAFSMHSFAGSSLHSPSCCFSLLHSPSRCILSLVRPFIRLLPGVNPLFVPPSQLFIGLSAGLFVRWFVRMDFRTICHSI